MDTRPDLRYVFRVVIAMRVQRSTGTMARLPNEVALRLATDSIAARWTLFLMSGGQEPFIDKPTSAFAARLTALLDSTKTSRLAFERREYPEDVHEMTPLPGLVDGLRMAFRPMLVPADSVVTHFAARNATDSAEISAAVHVLEARYSAGTSSLGIPARFPEDALDLLGSYALHAKQANLAVTLFRENRDRYPKSSNAHESLGEALVAANDTTRAVDEFRGSIALAREEAKSASVIVRGQARAVSDQARSQLQALSKRDGPGADAARPARYRDQPIRAGSVHCLRCGRTKGSSLTSSSIGPFGAAVHPKIRGFRPGKLGRGSVRAFTCPC